MKKFTITAFFLLIGSFSVAFAQQSDYEIKSEFEDKYFDLRHSLQTAFTVSELDSLRTQIDSLRLKYEDHEELLSVALYPNSFEESIEELEADAKTVEHRLLIIENQYEKMDTLLNELAAYESEIQQLNDRVASLRNEMQSTEKSEAELSGLVSNYRSSLEKRDQFILNVLDSILLRFENLDSEAVAELSEGAESGKVSKDENPLQIIDNIINENLEILKSSGDELATEDYLRIYVMQHRISEVWDQIGSELVTIYGGNDEQESASKIQNKLNEWQTSASQNLWDSMNAYLETANVQLQEFNNRAGFYAALEDYVKKNSSQSEEKLFTSGNRDLFQNFNEFWHGKIKNDWSRFVQEGEVLTLQQISAIDSEMVSWRENTQSRSLTWPILLGISVLVIAGLIVIIAKKK